MEPSPSISVIIPTRNRAESLRITLECLASADRAGIQAELIVVDNGSTDNTRQIAEAFQGRIPLRYVYEPAQGVYGKSHSLNRVLDAGGLGEIIAVLDDDMSPHQDWFQQLSALCKRWPDKDIFSGEIYTVWPSDDVPAWARTRKFQELVLSSGELDEDVVPLRDGRWWGGNHFWFRSRVLEGNRRFPDMWLTEPAFQLDLAELGRTGVADRKVRAGHRVQASLLDKKAAVDRARRFGREEAWLRLSPYRSKMKQARLLREHPWKGRLYCLARLLRARIRSLVFRFRSSQAAGFAKRLDAVSRSEYFLGLLRASASLDDYALWRKKRSTKIAPQAAGIASGAKQP